MQRGEASEEEGSEGVEGARSKEREREREREERVGKTRKQSDCKSWAMTV